MPAVALYRDFDLPWTPSADEERRLRRVLGAVLSGCSSRSASEEELSEMLRAAGVRDIARHPFPGPNDSSILHGTV